MLHINFLIYKTPFYGSDAFKASITEKWNTHGSRIVSLLEEITGMSIEGEFNVHLLNPKLESAQYLNETDIEWGYDELFPNYSIIGLAHELLHCLTHEFYTRLSDDEKWLFHSLVYLSADEELYRYFTSNAEYFTTPILSTYHPRLIETARKVLPEWRKRMSDPQRKNLIEFFEELR